jgi:hypothetical protein
MLCSRKENDVEKYVRGDLNGCYVFGRKEIDRAWGRRIEE